MKGKILRGAALCGLLVVASCATPYQKSGLGLLGGGYSDERINDSAYYVTFNGNGDSSREHVWYMWFYRCAELTKEKGYRYFYLKPKSSDRSELDGIRYATYHPGAVQFARGTPPMRAHAVKTGYVYIPTYTTITTWNSSGIVLMFPKPLPADQIWAVDADIVMSLLKGFVMSGGREAAPPRDEVMAKAFVSHAQIEVGDSVVVAPATAAVTPAAPAPAATPAAATAPADAAPAPATPAPAEKPLRTAASITNTFVHKRPLLAVAYSEWQKHGKAGPATVVLGFTVSPSGAVTEKKLVRSNSGDPKFDELMVILLKYVEFDVADVAATHVEVPISYTPNPDEAPAPAVAAPPAAPGAPANPPPPPAPPAQPVDPKKSI